MKSWPLADMVFIWQQQNAHNFFFFNSIYISLFSDATHELSPRCSFNTQNCRLCCIIASMNAFQQGRQSSAGIFPVSMETQSSRRRSGTTGGRDVQEAYPRWASCGPWDETMAGREWAALLALCTLYHSLSLSLCVCVCVCVCVCFLLTYSLSLSLTPPHTHIHTPLEWTGLSARKLRGQWKQKQDARENLSVQEEWSFHLKAATRHTAGAERLSQAALTVCQEWDICKHITAAAALCSTAGVIYFHQWWESYEKAEVNMTG